MTHQDMNTEHLRQCADAGHKAYSEDLQGNGEAGFPPCLAFAQAAISTYLKLNPVWVRASERMPTREDADENQWIWVYDQDSGAELFLLHQVTPNHLWTSIKHLPTLPDPFEDWLAKQPDDVRAADKELVRKIYNSIKP